MDMTPEKLLDHTSKPSPRPALLVLEDGSVFSGRACGAVGEAFGEICFNTSLEGYPEIITDPSYAGQIVVMTYPQIGNYGMTLADAQGVPALRGLVVRDMCFTPSSWRCDMPLPEYLAQEGIVGIEGVDTRALVQHIRDAGAMRAVISTADMDAAALLDKVRRSPSLVGVNLAATVSCGEAYEVTAPNPAFDFAWKAPGTPGEEGAIPRPYRVVVYDCGITRGILEQLVRAGCVCRVVPWDTPADEVLALAPDGVFLSNGPGDPEAVTLTYAQVERLLGRVPVFGICLGHQMMSLAANARMEKLKYGHHGGNQPVVNLLTGRVEITAQNHGFNQVFPSLGPLVPQLSGGVEEHPANLRFWMERGISPVVANPRFGRIRLTHVNANDGTAEGMAFMDIPAFSVQYHPEASPGPADSRYLFTAFTRLMEARACGVAPDDWSGVLDIDIATARLAGWRFGAEADATARAQGSCERFRTSENMWYNPPHVFASSGPSEQEPCTCASHDHMTRPKAGERRA